MEQKFILINEGALRYNGLYSPYPGTDYVFATLDRSKDGVREGEIKYRESLKTSQDVSRNGFVEPFYAPIYCKKRGF